MNAKLITLIVLVLFINFATAAYNKYEKSSKKYKYETSQAKSIFFLISNYLNKIIIALILNDKHAINSPKITIITIRVLIFGMLYVKLVEKVSKVRLIF